MTPLTRPPAACVDLIQFEAYLLDQERYEDWLALFADDLTYWLPVDPAQTRPEAGLNIIYDDRRRLTDRIRRITSGHAHTEDPPRWVARVVSPALAMSQDADQAVVRSGFMAFDTRNGVTTTHGGHYRHHLRRQEDRWVIIDKKIELAGSRTAMSALTCLL